MAISLTLPPELEQRLRQEAARHGLPFETFVLQRLAQQLSPAERRAAAVAMLELWAAEAETGTDEEAAGNAAVLRAIDDERPPDRRLFTEVPKDAKLD